MPAGDKARRADRSPWISPDRLDPRSSESQV